MSTVGKVEGLETLIGKFRDMPSDFQQRAMQLGLRAGAKIIRDEARAIAPRETGALAESVGYSKERTDTKWEIHYLIHGGFKNPIGDAYYWWMVENGTYKMAAQPYIRPAFNAKVHDAAKAVEDKLKQRVVLWNNKLSPR